MISRDLLEAREAAKVGGFLRGAIVTADFDRAMKHLAEAVATTNEELDRVSQKLGDRVAVEMLDMALDVGSIAWPAKRGELSETAPFFDLRCEVASTRRQMIVMRAETAG